MLLHHFTGLALILVALVDSHPTAEHDIPQERQKRFSSTSCYMSPDNSEEDVIEDNSMVTLTCTFDTEVDSCVWIHNEPMTESKRDSSDFDLRCRAGAEANGDSCEADTRVKYQFSSSSCGIQIDSTKPEDTGKWKLNAFGTANSGAPQSHTKEFEVHTFNESATYMFDEERNEASSFDTSYNRNEKRNEWEDGQNGWESVEFSCGAYGGRPEPIFKWYVNNNDNDDMAEDSHFGVSEGLVRVEDEDGYIRNIESTISFRIDDVLMEYLEEQGVDINPQDDSIRFDLNCEIQQGDRGNILLETMEMRIEKSYDNGALPADTVGLIVGVVLAVTVIIIAVALLFVARASKSFCFAENERPREDYDNRDQRHRNNQGGRNDRKVQKSNTNGADSMPMILPTLPPTKKSTSSSSNNSTAKRQHHPNNMQSNDLGGTSTHSGEWLDDKPVRSSQSSTTTTHSQNESPPPRPKKPNELTYANLDQRAFMHDPRNQVLPKHFPDPSHYAAISGNRLA